MALARTLDREPAFALRSRKAASERIDLLGVDDRQLIEIEPEHVMAKLKELEAAAECEDGGLLGG